jgi:hypothetical protein
LRASAGGLPNRKAWLALQAQREQAPQDFSERWNTTYRHTGYQISPCP